MATVLSPGVGGEHARVLPCRVPDKLLRVPEGIAVRVIGHAMI